MNSGHCCQPIRTTPKNSAVNTTTPALSWGVRVTLNTPEPLSISTLHCGRQSFIYPRLYVESVRHIQFSFLSVLCLQKRALLQLLERIAQLLLRVHHDWAVPRHRLLQRLAGNQQKADAVLTGLHGDFVAAVKEDKRAIISVRRRSGVEPVDAFRRHRQRAGGIAEFS